jgi:hypothetical protein
VSRGGYLGRQELGPPGVVEVAGLALENEQVHVVPTTSAPDGQSCHSCPT